MKSFIYFLTFSLLLIYRVIIWSIYSFLHSAKYRNILQFIKDSTTDDLWIIYELIYREL